MLFTGTGWPIEILCWRLMLHWKSGCRKRERLTILLIRRRTSQRSVARMRHLLTIHKILYSNCHRALYGWYWFAWPADICWWNYFKCVVVCATSSRYCQHLSCFVNFLSRRRQHYQWSTPVDIRQYHMSNFSWCRQTYSCITTKSYPQNSFKE